MKALKNAASSLLAVLLILLSMSFFACENVNPWEVDENKYEVTENFSFTVNLENQFRLDLRSINGPIEIIGMADSDKAEIWGERTVAASSRREALDDLDRLRVSVSTDNDEVFVETTQPGNTNGREFKVVYHVRIPATWDVFIKHVNGEIVIETINGFVDINHTNGNIIVEDLAGNLDIDLTNGQVVGKFTSLPPDGTCSVHLTNGQILLTIPKDSDAQLSASVTNGIVQVHDLTLEEMTSSNRSVTGKIGGGSANIQLRTINGNIDVRGY